MKTKNQTGRGAQVNPNNRFLKQTFVQEYIEGLDEEFLKESRTKYIVDHPKTILNKVPAEDIPADYSMNPYQGCEHGCIYCYARDTHQYWGHSSGLDFEKIIYVRPSAPELLEKKFRNPRWKPMPIMVSGNTDCYQPVERKLEITRGLLQVFRKYSNPVGIITKNSLIERDIDILADLAEKNLVQVMMSITTLDEDLRRNMEPRTASAKKKLRTIERLTEAGVPVGVMMAPIIPGLNSHEIPKLVKAVAEAGARTAAYTIVRLNGSIGDIFDDWLDRHYPDRKDKIIRQIKECHGGQLQDMRLGKRMKGEGNIAGAIKQLFESAKKKHLVNRRKFEFNLDAFSNEHNSQLSLFDG